MWLDYTVILVYKWIWNDTVLGQHYAVVFPNWIHRILLTESAGFPRVSSNVSTGGYTTSKAT